ncbi:Sedoheptulose-1,7-bisphosphatase, chloroplastic [Porphyridium purpureum]|uniref:Sedoheptulose-1,7-bisphosphatase, chloroplastic n=1 Tax=Porphyridium purpureum TaxID=35688 RepID=A0A5J4YRD3_PORPP|nr:Sedoheptulose-1,7-bisphosphatase, chloroplastic [Porphyridium purpureum]|eukprot:POR0273..scf296_7
MAFVSGSGVALRVGEARAVSGACVTRVHAAGGMTVRSSRARVGAGSALRMAVAEPATAADEGMLLEDWLRLDVDPALDKCVRSIFSACKEIAYKIRTASCDKMQCFNDFGDEQLAIDLLADKAMFENLTASGVVATASSEETPVEKEITPGGKYSVAFDPLDGSSIIDTNFSVGTIFGVWPGSKLTGITGRGLVAAGLAVYGPRTTITLSVEGKPYAYEFLLIDDFSGRHGNWILTKTFSTVTEGKLFAPGNLRAVNDNKGYAALVQFYKDNKYQLRYTGGMVPDVNQILIKGKGVFCNPESPTAKAKLRVLYEVAPIGYIMEKAGAKSSDGKQSVLDIPINNTEVKSQICVGSAGEVQRFEEMVGVDNYSPSY